MKTKLTDGFSTVQTRGTVEDVVAAVYFTETVRNLISRHRSGSVITVGNLSKGLIQCEIDAKKDIQELKIDAPVA